MPPLVLSFCLSLTRPRLLAAVEVTRCSRSPLVPPRRLCCLKSPAVFLAYELLQSRAGWNATRVPVSRWYLQYCWWYT